VEKLWSMDSLARSPSILKRILQREFGLIGFACGCWFLLSVRLALCMTEPWMVRCQRVEGTLPRRSEISGRQPRSAGNL
jgi:hypothetical protein